MTITKGFTECPDCKRYALCGDADKCITCARLDVHDMMLAKNNEILIQVAHALDAIAMYTKGKLNA